MPRRRARYEEGASAVEFALVVPLLVILVFGIIQFGIAYNRSQGMHASVREGARLASVSATADQVQARVGNSLDGTTVNASDVSITVWQFAEGADPNDDSLGKTVSGSKEACDGTAAGHTVRVDAVVTGNPDAYAISIPFLPSFGQTFPSTAIFRCEDRP